MRQGAVLLAIASGIVASGCLTSFRHPLGPPEDGFLESGLIGRWECASADDPGTLDLTIVDFDGRRYYVEVREAGRAEPGRYRGHATRIEGATFLNLGLLGADGNHEWSVMRYDLPGPDRLSLRMVDPDPFEDVIEDADRVRERLATRLDDPEVLDGEVSCGRRPAAPGGSR